MSSSSCEADSSAQFLWWNLPIITVPFSQNILTLAILVSLTAFGLVEAILHLKLYFGRALRKLISIVDPLVPSHAEISAVLSSPIPIHEIEEQIQEVDPVRPVVPGAEKYIQWADPNKKGKTPLCVVFFHGWSACRQEGRPVVGRMAKALNANLYCGRLPGHGRQAMTTLDVESSSPTSPKTTIKSPCGQALLEEALPHQVFLSALDSLRVGLSLGDRVVLVGMSTGGTLATWLASLMLSDDFQSLVDEGHSASPSTSSTTKQQLPLRERLASLVLFSPAYALGHPLYPVLKHSFAALRVLPRMMRDVARTFLIKAAVGAARNIPTMNDDHTKYCVLSYSSGAILHLLDILYELEIVNYASITIPTLMIGNPNDTVANFGVTANTFLKFGDAANKVLYCLTRGEHQHVVACDYASPSTVDEIYNVIRLFLNSNGISFPSELFVAGDHPLIHSSEQYKIPITSCPEPRRFAEGESAT